MSVIFEKVIWKWVSVDYQRIKLQVTFNDNE